MPQQKLNLNPKGLYTNVNQLGALPPGAALEAENAVISRPGVIGCRRGRDVSAYFAFKANDIWEPRSQPIRLFNAMLRVGGQYVTNFLGEQIKGIVSVCLDGTLWWSPDAKAFTQIFPTYGESALNVFSAAAGGRHYSSFEQLGHLFINTSVGVISIGRPVPNTPYTGGAPGSSEIRADWARSGYALAGTPWGLQTYVAQAASGTAAVPANSQVAYRFCFGYKDTNNILHLGAPSTRAVFVNATGGSLDTDVRTALPPGINRERHFYQLYRSQPSSASSADPGDDLALIKEGSLPQPFLIDGVTCSVGTTTVTVSAGHGLVSPAASPRQIVNILSDINIGAVSTFDGIYVSPIAGTKTLQIARQVAYGAPTLTAVADFTTATGDGYSPTVGEDDAVKIYKNDNNQFGFLVWHGTNRIAKLNQTGTVNSYINLQSGWFVERSAYDENSGKIYFLCRPYLTYGPGNGIGAFSYQYENSLVAVLDTSNDNVTYNSASPIPTQYDFRYCKQGTVALGLYRPAPSPIYGANPPVSLMLAVSSRVSYSSGPGGIVDGPLMLYMSSDLGTTWGQVRLNHPQYDLWEKYINCSVSVCNPATGTIDFLLGVRSQTGDFVAGTARAAIHGYTYNNNSPGPRWDLNAISTTLQANTPQYTSIKVNKADGRIFALRRRMIVNNFQVESVASLATYEVMSGFYAPVNITTSSTGTCRFLDYTGATVTAAVISNTNMLLWDVTPLLATAQTTRAITLYSPGGAYPWGWSESPAAVITPVIRAGAYDASTVPGSTTFTIVTNGVPNFPLTTVSSYAQVNEIVVRDNISPNFSGSYLYSSPSVEGALQMNFPPPISKDIALFRTTAFYANVKQRSMLKVSMLTLPNNNSRIYLGDNTAQYFTGSTSAEIVSQRQYYITTGGTLEQNIRATIDSLSRVVNAHYDTFKTLITTADTGPTGFSTFIVSGKSALDKIVWNAVTSGLAPDPAFTPNYAFGEIGEGKNILFYSKPGIPDAVPLLNSLRIGSDTKEIKRILASRDALFVFKDDGCFIVRGYGPPWQVDPYDLTLQLTIRDSLVLLDNAVFGAFSRGVFKVSDSNVELLSLPIQDQIEPHVLNDSKSDDYGFAVGDNPDHKYLLFVPRIASQIDYTDEVYVYDTFTNEWTKWSMPAMHGISYKDFHMVWAWRDYCSNGPVTATNVLGFAEGEYPAIFSENKTLTDADYFDGTIRPVPDVNETTLYMRYYDSTLNTLEAWTTADYPTANIGEDDIITAPDALANSLIGIMLSASMPVGNPVSILNPTAIEGQGTPFITPDTVGVYPVRVYKPISYAWKFAQVFPTSPAATNHFSEVALAFRSAYWTRLKVIFDTPFEQRDNNQTEELITLTGVAHFGELREPSFNNYVRMFVPRQKQRGTTLVTGFRVNVCGQPVDCNGVTLVLTQGPTSFQRK